MALPEDKETPSQERQANLPELIRAFIDVGKFILLAVLLLFLFFHWSTFRALLDRIDDLKFPWGEVHFLDRRKFSAFFQQGAVGRNLIKGNEPTAWAAFRQAEYVAPAIIGSRILWVDPHPANQRFERSLLEKLKIHIDVVRTTREAEDRVEEVRYDLVLSNIGSAHTGNAQTDDERDADSAVPLHTNYCVAGFYTGMSRGESVENLAGVIRAERLAMKDSRFMSHTAPRIIFYSASHADRMWDQCARGITNRTDVLLQIVVSALAEYRLDELPPIDEN